MTRFTHSACEQAYRGGGFKACRPVDDRISAGGYEVLLHGFWMQVPEVKVLHRTVQRCARCEIAPFCAITVR